MAAISGSALVIPGSATSAVFLVNSFDAAGVGVLGALTVGTITETQFIPTVNTIGQSVVENDKGKESQRQFWS